MSILQYLRITSIASALAVGFWLPLKMIGYHFPSALDVSLDCTLSAASVLSIAIFFIEQKKSFRVLQNWLHLDVALDVLSALPLLLIEDVLFHETNLGLIFLNLVFVRHIWRIKGFLDQFDNFKPIVYRLVPLGLTMPLLVHLIACGWIGLGSGTIGPDEDKTLEYVRAIYWAMTTLTTVGYGDIAAKTAAQMLYSAFTQLIGVGVFGFILSNVASLLSRLDAAREHHMDNLDQIETFMSSYNIPVDVKSRVRAYYHYIWREHKGRMDRTLIERLPNKLQSELNFSINQSVIKSVPFLKTATQDLIEDIMLALDHRVYVPGERIFRAGDPGDSLYMIHQGAVDIQTSKGQLIATLGEGAVFGERALIAEGPRSANATSVTHCDVYALAKADFQKIIQAYPEFKQHLVEIMNERESQKPL